MAVSTPAVSETTILLPSADEPIGVVVDGKVYLSPSWRRALQMLLDRHKLAAELLNDVRAEVNLHHP